MDFLYLCLFGRRLFLVAWLVLDAYLLVCFSPRTLQSLHLARLQVAKVLLAHVDLARLVAHDVGVDVLLCALLGALWLLERLLHHVWVGEHFPSEAEVHARAHFLDFDAGKFLATALGAQEIETEFYFRVREGVGGFYGGDGDQVLETFDVDFGCVLAFEEVDEQGLGQCVFCLRGVFEDCAVETYQWLEANRRFLVLELLQRAEGFGVDVELQHIQHLVRECARDCQAVRTLLGVQRQHDE